MTDEVEYRFDPVTKNAGESRAVELEWFNLCANFWRSNEAYSASEYVRPNVSTGFAYQTTGGGLSGAREPRWPTTLGATVVDGSITWTCVAASANGLNAVSSPSCTPDDAALTVTSVSVSENTKVLATYGGGSLDADYEAVWTVTINGLSRIGRQKVLVRKL